MGTFPTVMQSLRRPGKPAGISHVRGSPKRCPSHAEAMWCDCLIPPVAVELLNELLKVCAEAAKAARAETRDGERVFEEIEREGLKPNNETVPPLSPLLPP